AFVKLVKYGGSLYIEQAGIIPTVTHFGKDLRDYQVYPYYAYTLAGKHGLQYPGLTLKNYFDNILTRLFRDGVLNYDPFL
ncbi:MAG: hypothetical protein LBI85_04890, partial [Spirochaetaceae bacterium]|nr:hypothetical protein [Spirochaetaceae bacterium]